MNKQDNAKNSTEKAAIVIAVILSVVWLTGIAVVYFTYPTITDKIIGNLGVTMLVVGGLLLPMIIIWMIAMMAQTLSGMRQEATRLRKSVETMRQTLDVRVAEESETRDRWIQSQLAQITALTKQTDNRVTALAQKTLEERGELPPPRNIAALFSSSTILADAAQADLPLPKDFSTSSTPITVSELIKALNFPDNAKDAEGFHVLRRVFNDRITAKLLQSAQDVLTMLSQDGIFMDDLRVEKPATSAWRSFAKGVRGKEVAALGMVRDRTAMTLANTRLKNDMVFRETVHAFLTQFDAILTEFEKIAEDTELAELGKTRSALAFMLLGRVSGAFDAR